MGRTKKSRDLPDYVYCSNCSDYNDENKYCEKKGKEYEPLHYGCTQFNEKTRYTKEEIVQRLALLDVLKDTEEETKRVLLSGLLDDDTFFHTIFLDYKGTFKPFVFTSAGEVLTVINNESELLRMGKKRKEIKAEDIYDYFVYKGRKHKYALDLKFRDDLKIFTINREIIEPFMQKITGNKSVFNKIVGKIKEYYDHHNPYEYDIAAVSSIDTYFLRAINKTFYYLPHQIKEDTGKSTLQKVLARLQFNSLYGGKGTVAVNVRLVHCFGCNYNQDEFDKLSDQERKVFMGVANTGLYGDGTYNLVDTNKRTIIDQITSLNTFGKKTFSTNKLSQFDRYFMSRCYVNICTRQNRKLKDINLLTIAEENEFQDLRNKQFIYVIFHWKEIVNSIKIVKVELEDEGIFGRKTDMNSIILGIVKHFKGDYYKKVKEHLKQKEDLKQVDNSNTKEGLTYRFLVSKFMNTEKTINVTNKEICEYIQQELDLNEEEIKSLSKTVGWIMKGSDLVRSKEHVKKKGKGNKLYIIEKSIFLDTLRRFQYSNLLELIQTGNPPVKKVETVKTEKQTTVSTNNTVSTSTIPKRTFSELKKDYKGACSYCGFKDGWIRYKDKEGNHLCNDCYHKELDK